MLIESPDGVRAEGTAHVNINRFRVDLSDRTLSAIALAFSAVALAVSIMLVTRLHLAEDAVARKQDDLQRQMSITEREARLAAQDSMLLKASVIAHGIPVNEDQLSGRENVSHNDHHPHK